MLLFGYCCFTARYQWVLWTIQTSDRSNISHLHEYQAHFLIHWVISTSSIIICSAVGLSQHPRVTGWPRRGGKAAAVTCKVQSTKQQFRGNISWAQWYWVSPFHSLVCRSRFSICINDGLLVVKVLQRYSSFFKW